MRSAGYEPSLSSLRNFNLKPTQVEARALGLGVTGESEEDPSDPADTVDPAWSSAAPVTKPCDLWELGDHHLLCGNARSESDLARLMSGSQAAMAFLDPPYNVRIRHIVGRGRIKHGEFAMGSAEFSRTEFVEFLKDTLGAAATVSCDGAVHYVCIDWRHIGELLEAAGTVYGDTLNIAVWVKSKRRPRLLVSKPTRTDSGVPGW